MGSSTFKNTSNLKKSVDDDSVQALIDVPADRGGIGSLVKESLMKKKFRPEEGRNAAPSATASYCSHRCACLKSKNTASNQQRRCSEQPMGDRTSQALLCVQNRPYPLNETLLLTHLSKNSRFPAAPRKASNAHCLAVPLAPRRAHPAQVHGDRSTALPRPCAGRAHSLAARGVAIRVGEELAAAHRKAGRGSRPIHRRQVVCTSNARKEILPRTEEGRQGPRGCVVAALTDTRLQALALSCRLQLQS